MKIKKNLPILHQAARKTSNLLSLTATVDKLKGVIITFSVWGWLPLGLGNWALRKRKIIDSAKHFKDIV